MLFANLLGTFDKQHAAYTKAPIKLVEGAVQVYAVKAVSYETEPAEQQNTTLWMPEEREGEGAAAQL